MTAAQPTGRDGADSGLPRSSRKGRQERRMQSPEQRRFYAVSQIPAGPQTLLDHEASKHLAAAACQGLAGD